MFRIFLFLAAFAVAAQSAEIAPLSPGAPNRAPQLAVRGTTVVLAFGAGNSIYFTRSLDSGHTFAPPVEVSHGAVIPLSRHRGPRIAFSGSTIVITAVIGKTLVEGPHAHGLPSDGDLLAWRSADNGQTWSQGVVINDVPAAATEGLHALAAGPRGRLFSVWLDKRAGTTQLYGSLSTDAGRTWQPNIRVYASPDGTICQCCHPSVAFDPSGAVLVMWRNDWKGCRDMYLARSANASTFAPPQKLGNGEWHLEACPMDGGALAVAGRAVTTVWRREHSIFLDKPGQPEQKIGEGTDVALAATQTGVYAIWSTPAGLEWFNPSGATRPLEAKGAFPAVIALGNRGALAAWENEGHILVRQLE